MTGRHREHFSPLSGRNVLNILKREERPESVKNPSFLELAENRENGTGPWFNLKIRFGS